MHDMRRFSKQACDVCANPSSPIGLECVISDSNILLAVSSLSLPQTKTLYHFQEHDLEEEQAVAFLGSPWRDLVCTAKAVELFKTQLTHVSERSPKNVRQRKLYLSRSMACYFVGFVNNLVEKWNFKQCALMFRRCSCGSLILRRSRSWFGLCVDQVGG